MNAIATRTAMTDSEKSWSHNVNPKLRNKGNEHV
jgi:hypothetical protein